MANSIPYSSVFRILSTKCWISSKSHEIRVHIIKDTLRVMNRINCIGRIVTFLVDIFRMIVVYHVYFSVIYSFIWSVWGWMVIFLIWNQVQVFWAKVYICNFYKSFVVQVLYWAQSSESSRCFENEIHVQITYLYPLLSTLLVQLIYMVYWSTNFTDWSILLSHILPQFHQIFVRIMQNLCE